MGELTEPDDHMGPEDLIDAAAESLLTALASLDDIRRSLQGHSELPRHERLDVVLLSARPRCRAGERKSARRPRKRGAFPRSVE